MIDWSPLYGKEVHCVVHDKPSLIKNVHWRTSRGLHLQLFKECPRWHVQLQLEAINPGQVLELDTHNPVDAGCSHAIAGDDPAGRQRAIAQHLRKCLGFGQQEENQDEDEDDKSRSEDGRRRQVVWCVRVKDLSSHIMVPQLGATFAPSRFRVDILSGKSSLSGSPGCQHTVRWDVGVEPKKDQQLALYVIREHLHKCAAGNVMTLKDLSAAVLAVLSNAHLVALVLDYGNYNEW